MVRCLTETEGACRTRPTFSEAYVRYSEGLNRRYAGAGPHTFQVASRQRTCALPVRRCVGCGELFVPRRPAQLHCKPACRAEAARQRDRKRIADLLGRLDPCDPGRAE